MFPRSIVINTLAKILLITGEFNPVDSWAFEFISLILTMFLEYNVYELAQSSHLSFGNE